jgi:RimJ/RimL family protein N-acetyltransferase
MRMITEAPSATRLLLRDGTPALLRPIHPLDRQLLKEAFEGLSDYTRYQRFMGWLPNLSDEQLSYLTDIDHRDHMAWLAVEEAPEGERALGVARYIRFVADPSRAEVAVTVVDSHQGRGLGTLLLSFLSQSAAANSVDLFVAYVLQDNRRIVKLLRDLGAYLVVSDPGTSVMRVEMPVPLDVDDVPHTAAGSVFRAVARGTIGCHWSKTGLYFREPHDQRGREE